MIKPDAPAKVKLAAKELRRYVYLRTGELLPVADSGLGIALKIDPSLATQQYRLKTADGTLTLSGGSGVAVLYAAYAFEKQTRVWQHVHGFFSTVAAWRRSFSNGPGAGARAPAPAREHKVRVREHEAFHFGRAGVVGLRLAGQFTSPTS